MITDADKKVTELRPFFMTKILPYAICHIPYAICQEFNVI